MNDTGLILPPGVAERERSTGTLVNETDLPDEQIHFAVIDYIEEHASVLGAVAGQAQLQTYNGPQGSLLARRGPFRLPTNPIEEIVLARDLAERDDDCASAIGAMLAIAFGDGMQNSHRDEVTVAQFDEVARHGRIEHLFLELYREWLIAGCVTTATIYTRDQMQFQPQTADRQRTRTLTVPVCGVLPSELIRVLDNDVFGAGRLAYRPATGSQEKWLSQFFDPSTTPAMKAQMRREDPVLTTLLVEEIRNYQADVSSFYSESWSDPGMGDRVYRLNPRLVARSTMPKGAWKYPRPPLTRNFALIEAKRLLNIMDAALLQGGANFLVVAKKGSDLRPAMQPEVDNLREVLKRSSHTGLIVGDHRINIEVITPDLKELLNPSKRKLLGRKLAMALLRTPDFTEAEGGAASVEASVEIFSRVIAGDRRALYRHVKEHIYEEVVARNPGQFPAGPANIWFPRIILQGSQYFEDYVLKLRDRGDIPRRYAVEAAGFDYDDAVAQRKREKANGDDRVLTPAAVPFSLAQGGAPSGVYGGPTGQPGPQDNGPGRPVGSGPNNGAPGARKQTGAAKRPTRIIQQNAGETVRAMFDDELGAYRVGEQTFTILEQYPDREVGRITRAERDALSGGGVTVRDGSLTIAPVNGEHQIDDVRALRLAPGLSLLVGSRILDDALVARAFVFREPDLTPLDGQEIALRFGFEIDLPLVD